MSTRGPLHAVLTALEDGAGSLDEVRTKTGLPRDMVDAAVAHLVRIGRLSTESLAFGCPAAGCGSCAAAGAGGGCDARSASSGSSGLVLVAITVPKR